MRSAISPKERLQRFGKSEDGSALIETVLWIPFFLFVILMVLDASMIFMNYGRAQRVVQYDNRDFAVGVYETCAEFEAAVEAELQSFIPSADATCGIQGNMALVAVTMNSGDMELTGASGWLGGMNLSMASLYKTEYSVPGE